MTAYKPLLLTIKRTKLPTETLGSIITSIGEIIAKTMELPWDNNHHNTSCIPNGTYWVKKEKTSPGHTYPHFRVLNVPDREGILWHRITYVKDLRGCTGIVGKFFDLNKDGTPDAIESGITLQKLYDTLPDLFQVEYRDAVTV